jgi:uncharacterized protein (DUF2236 family)
MARPRRYTTDTERRQAHAQSQRAYRRRQVEETVPVDRAAVAALLTAVDAAAAAGDPVARRVRTATADGLVRNLGHHFRARATGLDAPPPTSKRPVAGAPGGINEADPGSG